MKQKLMLAVSGLMLATALSFSPANALPSLGTASAPTEGLVQNVHFHHRSCEWGPGGWHRYVGLFANVRIPCYPVAAHPFRCYVGRWGYRHCFW